MTEADSQHLDKSERTETKVFSKDREISVEELARKTELRADQDNGLKDDEQSVQDCPKSASRLVRHSASPIQSKS